MRSIAKAVMRLLLALALAACAVLRSPALTGVPAGGTVVPPTDTTRATLEPTAGPTSRLSLSIADAGRTIAVPVGSEVDITLQTVGPVEYANPQVSSPAVRFLTMSYVTPPVPAGPTQLFRFEAVAPGQATISISGASNNPKFQVTVKSN